MSQPNLQDAVTDSVVEMASMALYHFEEGQTENAAALINEWTTESNECVLTHHYTDTVHTVSDIMMYTFTEDNQFGYGRFTFNPDVELVD